MSRLTVEQLKSIMPFCRKAHAYVDPLNDAMEEWEINTPLRQAAFLAQLAHESGEMRYMREIASGEAYEGREDLGNTEEGDGRRFRGWGWIQTTGRKNTRIVSVALFGDTRLVDDPSLIDPPTPELAARAAGHFWSEGAGMNLSKRAIDNGVEPGVDLNELADKKAFKLITLAVNGGMNGVVSRDMYYARALKVLS